MRYKNANIFVDDHFILGSFTVENGVFTEISEDTTSAGEDLAGDACGVGTVDLHFHVDDCTSA